MKSGDRVRVTYDATYMQPFGGRHLVNVKHRDGGISSTHELPVDAVIEVITPEIGDVIDAVEAERLPNDSAVLCLINCRPYVVLDGGLWSGAIRMEATAGGDCRILYVGGRR